MAFLKARLSPFGVLTFIIFVIGFIAGLADYAVLDIVLSCYETACEDFPSAYSIWYDFTSEALVYLYTPILFMFILLHYDIVDTKREENRWLIRILVILLLLIVSSTILELIQSFLPIPDMISSAALAIVVGIFIGWEEKIVSSLIEGSASIQDTVPDFLGEGDGQEEFSVRTFNIVFGCLTAFILVISVLFTGLGVMGGQSMSEEQTNRNLLMTKESRIPTFSAYAFTLLLMLVTVGDFVGDLRITAQFTSSTPEWEITFETQNQTMQTVETLQDDETRNVIFELSDINVPEGFKIGQIDVALLPEELDGDDDWNQCDSIAGDILENELTAQWDDAYNNPTCLPIDSGSLTQTSRGTF